MHGYSMNKLIEYRCQVGFAYSEVERCYGALWRCREKTKSILRKWFQGFQKCPFQNADFLQKIRDAREQIQIWGLGGLGGGEAFLHFYQI